jgi:hypothetical protein
MPRRFSTPGFHRADGTLEKVTLKSRINTAIEVEYVRHGGILSYVLRQLLGAWRGTEKSHGQIRRHGVDCKTSPSQRRPRFRRGDSELVGNLSVQFST